MKKEVSLKVPSIPPETLECARRVREAVQGRKQMSETELAQFVDDAGKTARYLLAIDPMLKDWMKEMRKMQSYLRGPNPRMN